MTANNGIQRAWDGRTGWRLSAQPCRWRHNFKAGEYGNMGIWEYYSVSSWKPIPVTALAQHCKKQPPGHEEQEELTTLIAALNFQPNGKLVITPDLSANSSNFINFIPVSLFSIFIYAKKQ